MVLASYHLLTEVREKSLKLKYGHSALVRRVASRTADTTLTLVDTYLKLGAVAKITGDTLQLTR